MILIVDMNWKKDSLSYNEFILPIVSALKPLEDCAVEHFSNLNLSQLSRYSKIILSGTPLKDHATLKQIEKFAWIKTATQPILGICAGIQTISLVYGQLLNRCFQVGITEITTTKSNPLFSGTFKAYTLHHFSVEQSSTFEAIAQSATCVEAVKQKHKEIYGVLFHPEVRNQEILQRFIQLPLF